MARIIMQLDPAKLDHPDVDIRYLLPDLPVSPAGGLRSDGGYDYVEEPLRTTLLVLKTDEPDAAVRIVIETLSSVADRAEGAVCRIGESVCAWDECSREKVGRSKNPFARNGDRTA